MKKIITIILDGFGLREDIHGNAIKQAKLLNFDMLWNTFPHSTLYASEKYVGLPDNQFGNSEVGHLTIGAGRKVLQPMLIMDNYIKDKMITDERYLDLINNIKNNNGRVHLMGLLSDGGVHSNIKHFLLLLNMLKESGLKEVYIHAITDGRDSYRTSALKYITYLNENIKKIGIGTIGTICGRYYAMDRDSHYERTKIYSDLITMGKGSIVEDLPSVLDYCYKKDVTDEFLPPLILDKESIIKDYDTIIWMNYRSDRSIQILDSLSNKEFNKYPTKKYNNLNIKSFFKFNDSLNIEYFLEYEKVNNSLGVYLSELGLSQARIAETEKYSHVTKFFDGECLKDLDKCDKFLIPSVRVKTYDLSPDMSALEITNQAKKCLDKDYDFILVNYANADMLGHTGNFEATIKGLEFVDSCLGNLIKEAQDNFYTAIIIADHGNADMMLDESNNIITTHTCSKVPFIITDKKLSVKEGDLTNIAPSILKYMDIKIPEEMKETGTLF